MTMPSMALSKSAADFIDDAKLTELTNTPAPSSAQVNEIIAKAMAKEPLTVGETATLIAADRPDHVETIFEAARQLKRDVYGNRVVLFAPMYVGSNCINDCTYCSFRRSNPDAFRRTLTSEELAAQVKALEDVGHKRLIMVWGEHPDYDAQAIADAVREVYQVRSGYGEIRRVNINAAPLDDDGFRRVKDAGIGTYQIFQETYHHATYAKVHPSGRKGDYLYRLDGLDRAYTAGCDDVGIGALFGLADWRFDLLGLVTHARHLSERFGCGPHTISFPRLRPAAGADTGSDHLVSDADFMRIVAILRLAVPYTGLILTAREPAKIRRQIMAFGVSQIDAGSRIEIGGYTETGDAQVMEREQFCLGDMRSLDEVMRELLTDGYLPSFCTACYRLGRTGEQFMEFAIPGFIQQFCTPNALLTLLEYLKDYASNETLAAGNVAIANELTGITDGPEKDKLIERLERIRSNAERDLYF